MTTTYGDITGLWAQEQVTTLLDDVDKPLPVYGDRAWVELPEGDPRKAAAIITAAETWRREEHEKAWRDELWLIDRDAWWRAVTDDADAAASRLGRTLASTPTWEECRRRRQNRPPTPVKASPGWTPVAIPGRPGHWRHYIDGRQVDAPTREMRTAA